MKLNIDQIKQLVTEINSAQNINRKKAEFDLYQGCVGGLLPYVRNRVKEIFPKTGHLYHMSDYAIGNKIVSKKAKSYKEAPIRKLTQQKDTERYSEICKRFGLNKAMRKFDENYCRARQSLLAVFMTEKEDDTRKKELEFTFSPLLPFQYDIQLDDEGELKIVILSYTPEEVKAGALNYLGQDLAIAGSEAREGGGKEQFYVIWTDEGHYLVREKKEDPKLVRAGVTKENSTIELVAIESNPGNDNPFGILPFVWPNNGTSNYPETNPMGNQAIEMNAMMSIYLTSGSMQIGQLVLEFPADQPIGDSVHGLMASIKLPQSNDPEKKPTKASYISPTPDLAGQRQSILTFMSLILDQQSLGVTGAFDGEQTFNSGLDRMIANADVQDAIEVNQEAYRDAENQIYKIVSTMLKELNQGFSDENELQIVFRKPKMLITDKEKLENIKLMDDLNMLEPWEKLVIFDPNLSEDEAKKKMSLIEAAKPKPEPMNNGPFNFGNNGRA